MPALTASEAARALNLSPSQVRRLAALPDAPFVVRRRRPLLVDLEGLRGWRQGQRAEVLGAVAQALAQALRCELVDGMSAPVALGLNESKCAVLLLHAFDLTHIRLVGHEPEPPWPPAIESLRRIAGGR